MMTQPQPFSPPHPFHAQSGSVLVVVIFVVVIMGMLASVMAQLEWSNQDIQTREVLGTRAWFAAHTANEWALTQLFPLNQSVNHDELTARCHRIASQWAAITPSFTPEGCQIQSVQCSPQLMPDNYEAFQTYQLISTASCGTAETFYVERAQEVIVRGME